MMKNVIIPFPKDFIKKPLFHDDLTLVILCFNEKEADKVLSWILETWRFYRIGLIGIDLDEYNKVFRRKQPGARELFEAFFLNALIKGSLYYYKLYLEGDKRKFGIIILSLNKLTEEKKVVGK